METKQPQVIDELVSFQEDYTDSTLGTQLVIKRQQDITESYLDGLKEQRDAPHDTFGNRMARVASIPTSIVHKWDREGYPWEQIFHGPNGPALIIKKLKQEEMDKLLTTRKSF